MKPLKPLYKAIYYFIFYTLGWAVRLLYPLKVLGRENLPRGGYVLAPNHLFAIDPMYVILARGCRPKMLVMGKEELFEKGWLLNFIWKVFGAFPVDRGSGNRGLLDEVSVEVKRGHDLLIFPEGTRSRDGKLLRMKSGAFVVAQEAGVPIVPCRIWYAAGGPRLFGRIYIAFGKPLSMEALGLVEYTPKNLRAAKDTFVASLEELSGEISKACGGKNLSP